MDYEHKYKEGLSFLKDLRPHMSYYCKEKLDGFFPELRESEDERIRKEIISFITDRGNWFPKEETKSSWIVWLEKQGEQKPIEQDTEIHDLWVYIREWNEKFGRLPKDEDELASCIDYVMKRQKPADKIEPKFKVGDWILIDRPCRIELIDDNGDYVIQYYDSGTKSVFSKKFCETHFHLWTIQDAKDGDVLKEDSCMFIVEKMKSEGTAIVYCCLFDDGDFDLIGSTLSFDVDSTYPATKEQRDFLFQKMKEASYEWDAEKKELKKIEQSSWSEEDEHCIELLLPIIDSSSLIPKNRKKCKEFLKSLKPNHWKPSEEQMQAIKFCCANFEEYNALKSLYNDLKNL